MNTKPDSIQELFSLICGEIMDTETFLSHVSPDCHFTEAYKASRVGYFLQNRGERIIELADKAEQLSESNSE